MFTVIDNINCPPYPVFLATPVSKIFKYLGLGHIPHIYNTIEQNVHALNKPCF